ncbi:uncharacterized protein LOC119608880 [Lucilia sericata]|uniref:uncharacterized protein LOC119608880 n=1 Tax=Lucilia sericata TaxID=13632 RepID=UPI0018A7E9F0|nr:uncharacterized protein LOC119608880 [Lucilia sericata]
MDKIKIKVIGVLKERDEKINNLEWTREWLKKYQHEFLNKENIRKELLFRSNEIYHLNCFFNITEKQFRYLVNILEPLVTVLEPHRKKKSFSAEERIAITLKYLATGEVNSCRNYCFRASKPVIVKMIADICQKMYELLKDQYLYLPKTDEQWLDIVNNMQKSYHISNCLGNILMDQVSFYTPPNQPVRPRSFQKDNGEDNSIQKPPLIMTTIVDGNYNFLYIDVEKTKAKFYDQIYEKSKICKMIEDGSIALPRTITDVDGTFKNCDIHPYFFMGSKCLPDKPYLLLKSQLPSNSHFDNVPNSNSNLSGQEVNDTLCILSNLFPVLSQPLRLCEADAQKIIMGSVALYNYLRRSDSDYCKLTNKIILRGNDDKQIVEDDDCILIDNEDEQKEREEFTPNVCVSTCFRSLHKQRNMSSNDLPESDIIL